jgi:hypothetical protein
VLDGLVTNNSMLTKSNILLTSGTFVNNGSVVASGSGSHIYAGDGEFQNLASVSAPGGIQFNAETRTLNAVTGTMSVTGGTAALLGTMTNHGLITTAGAATVGTALHNFGNVTVGSGNIVLTGAIDNHGSITLTTGSATVNQAGTLALYTGSTLSLDGGNGTLTNNGVLRAYAPGPGDAAASATAGTFALDGSLAMASTVSKPSRLEVELGGTAQGTQYDLYDIDGDAAIDAAIDIRFLNNFQNSVQASDVFTILTADTITSGNVRNPWIGGPAGRVITADHLGSFAVTFTSDSIVLSNFSTSVPEPGAVAFTSAVGLVILLRRRRNLG